MSASAVQTLVVVLVVATALLYLGRRFWRTLAAARARKKGEAGCGVGCGCEATTPNVGTLKARRSEIGGRRSEQSSLAPTTHLRPPT